MADQNLLRSKWGRGRAKFMGIAQPTESSVSTRPALRPPAPMPPGAAPSMLLPDKISQKPGASGDSRQQQGAFSIAELTELMFVLANSNVRISASSRCSTDRTKDTGPYLTSETLNFKLGTSGQPSNTDWCLYQYRVEFEPDEDSTFVRKLLMRAHKDYLKGYIFDGIVLYTSHRLFPESKDELELFSLRTNDNVKIRMRICQAGNIVLGDSHRGQLFNTLMRMSLSTTSLQIVGRDFFDAISKVEVLQWKLVLWPGYKTLIRTEFLHKYGLHVQPDQPLLVSNSKPQEPLAGCSALVPIVPELYRCTGVTDAVRINFRRMQDLHHHPRLSPEQMMESLLACIAELTKNPETRDLLTRWNLEQATELCSFKGCILPQEDIIVKDSKHKSGHDTDWIKCLHHSSMLTNYSLKNWCVVGLAVTMRDAKVFAEEVIKSGNCMKFQIGRPDFLEIKGQDCLMSYIETIEQVITERNPQLILCSVTTNGVGRYSAIKKCGVDRAVPTQVVTAKSMRSKNIGSLATKVAIQMNCKIGGAPWAVEIPLGGLMVVGFDVCHDTPMKGKSYGALVCSLDKALSRYFSHVTAYTSSEELNNHNMSVGMTAALASYKSYNEGRLPERIAMYRDGVGDGQIPYVLNCEMKHLIQMLTAIYKGQPPKFAFIIVTKKINSRLFLNKQNLPSGTVADDVIKLPHCYDFFLVSQSVRQGAVSPTSYNVIYDTTGLSPDKMQRLTYKLTHFYFNWSGTVRVPAPVQYAHKLAFLVGQANHTAPSQQVQLLYFL